MKRLYIYLGFIIVMAIILCFAPDGKIGLLINFYKVILPIIPLFEVSAIIHEVGEAVTKILEKLPGKNKAGPPKAR